MEIILLRFRRRSGGEGKEKNIFLVLLSVYHYKVVWGWKLGKWVYTGSDTGGGVGARFFFDLKDSKRVKIND